MAANIAVQNGLSLVEILITVLILAIGSLGIASMQIAGLKYSSGSYARSQATHLADDMASRLKSNREEALDLQTNGSFGASPAYVINSFSSSYTTTENCITGTCTPAELTSFDKNAWLADIARAIPSGKGRVTFTDSINADGVTERMYSIEIQWRQTATSSDADGAAADDIKSIAYRISI
nr:hypothetical protein [uncultured bacterium]